MKDEDVIKKAFNAAYLLQKHNPELAAKIESGFVNKEEPYALGFIKGRQIFEYEQIKDKSSKSKTKGKKLVKEKGKAIEPEI